MATSNATEQANKLALIVEHPARGAVIVLDVNGRIDGAVVVRLRRGGPVVLESICKRADMSLELRDRGVPALLDAALIELFRLGASLGPPAVFYNSSHPSFPRVFHSAAKRSGRLQFAGAFGNDYWYSHQPVSPRRTLLRHRSFVLSRWLQGERVLDACGAPVRVSLRQLWTPSTGQG